VFRRRIAKALVLAALTGAVAAIPGTPASGHRHGCHGAHTCPSDQATYRAAADYRREAAVRQADLAEAQQHLQQARALRRIHLLLQAMTGRDCTVAVVLAAALALPAEASADYYQTGGSS